MQTLQNILTRRSIRRYLSDPIPRQDLEEILQAGTMAPSAVNLQPWYFVAVESEGPRAELVEIMGQVFGKFRPMLEARFANHPETVEETRQFLEGLGGAPVCVLAFLLKDYQEDKDGAEASTCAAMENILLAAWEKGIGSCWLTAPKRMGFGPALQARFAPGKGEFVGAITLGYPDQSPAAPRRREGRYEIL
jgi:nitroreductase